MSPVTAADVGLNRRRGGLSKSLSSVSMVLSSTSGLPIMYGIVGRDVDKVRLL